MVKSIEGFGIVVAVILGVMSIYSLGVMAERLVTYSGRTRPRASTRRACATSSRREVRRRRGARKLKRGHLPKVLGLDR